ncbi:NAD(P)-dependent oxidoreductase [Paenibacillus sp. JCM 10914]|uniref:NAD-dependent epimerase/dehydratase family protein n=1 Tax=Paenibacillus sp. JCM 10914 TaxID=1236974 RepID=UPI0003CC4684|nr:NAD(P)-dependent oxidoreductase [Paenibacillus sp. JCM 10914]GAE05503.1 UDP-glucose 4-epimerase [Paenibacillus sp. JCM 10914]
MNKVIVTGSEGKLGHYVVQELNQAGYTVFGTDSRPASGRHGYARYVQADLNQLGEVYGLLADADAVIHLAAIPNPVSYTPERIFTNNVMSTYNIMEAASNLGIKRVIFGSSESAYGFCWAKHPFAPDYLPVNEDHDLLPQESYGLSKQVNEQTGDMFVRRVDMEVFAMRFSMVVAPNEYEREIAAFEHTARHHRSLWSYIDARDAAVACRLALEAEGNDDRVACRLNITASDIISNVSIAELTAKHYPGVQIAEGILDKLTAFVSNERAQARLNWKPQYSWKQVDVKSGS